MNTTPCLGLVLLLLTSPVSALELTAGFTASNRTAGVNQALRTTPGYGGIVGLSYRPASFFAIESQLAALSDRINLSGYFTSSDEYSLNLYSRYGIESSFPVINTREAQTRLGAKLGRYNLSGRVSRGKGLDRTSLSRVSLHDTYYALFIKHDFRHKPYAVSIEQSLYKAPSKDNHLTSLLIHWQL